MKTITVMNPAPLPGQEDRNAAPAAEAMPAYDQEPDRGSFKVGTRLDGNTNIGPSEGRESLSRLLAYTALVLVAAVLVYLAIAHSAQPAGESSSGYRPVARERSNLRTLPGSSLVGGESRAGSSTAGAAVTPEPASLTLTPSLILSPGKPGQTTSHSLTIQNGTRFDFNFQVEARDLVIRNGMPVFLAAGELPDGIAARLLLAPRSLNVKATRTASVDVRVTVPSRTQVRGVLITLKGADRIPAGAESVMTASLGTLISLTGQENTPAQTSEPSQPATASAVSFSVAPWLDEVAPAGTEAPAPETPTGDPADKPVGSGQP